jgi:hypothetical protein
VLLGTIWFSLATWVFVLGLFTPVSSTYSFWVLRYVIGYIIANVPTVLLMFYGIRAMVKGRAQSKLSNKHQ